MVLFMVSIAAVAGFLFWPAKPVDLSKFQPENFAMREANAWRAYYEERYLSLFWQVFQISHAEYGFSLKDSLRMSFHAAKAAHYFRRSNEPVDVARAQGEMDAYYRIISEATNQPFDHAAVAKLEVQWWQMRRARLAQEEWAQAIARQCAIIYRQPFESFLPPVRLRVAAMALRDSKRDQVMSDDDWHSIEAMLSQAAGQFREVVVPVAGGS